MQKFNQIRDILEVNSILYKYKTKDHRFKVKHREGDHYLSEIRLANYHRDEVWLEPVYSYEWKVEKNVIVNIKRCMKIECMYEWH